MKFSLKDFHFDYPIFKKSLAIGLPSGVQMMLVSIGMMAVTRIVNGFGTNAVAAFTAAGRLDTFAVMPAMNFSAAISTFVGQNLGAKKPERVKKGFRTTLLMSCAVSLIISITVILFGRQMISLFNSDPAVIGIGVNYLAIVGAFYILFTVMFVTNGVLRGAGATFIPMIISVLSLWLIRVPISVFLSARIGTDGIWWAMPIAWTVGLALTIGYYLSGGWKKKHIVETPKTLSEPVPFEEDESEYNVSKF